ncbi:unnamed protein product, partial [Porites evermanni]
YKLNQTELGPSLESFIQASITDDGRELRFPGLAVTSTLKDACQALIDVSKAKIPANKIALVILLHEDETACPMQDLALEAQRAGYSHKVVTRYVFYISVCMICAYIESDVVALFYFTLNSQGSLQNVKLTAIRTAAITLTLLVSFRTSMHIIRKLINPSESLFEGLSEQ